MAKITLTIEDNPMRGLPGQPDFLTIVSSDPLLPLPVSEETVEGLTPAQMAAIQAVSKIADSTYETAWLRLSQDSPQ